MNKGELIDSVSAKTEYSKKSCDEIIKAMLETIQESLVNGESVSFIGFGTFSVGERSAREGKNPATGEKIKIPAAKVPKFKAGKALKDAVNTPKKKK